MALAPGMSLQIENFDPPPDEDLICCICRSVFQDPVECPCRHVFCRDCIGNWLSTMNTCPVCRLRASTRSLTPVLPIIRNMIARLTLFCPNKANGCSEKITIEGYQKHLEQCLFELVTCSNKSCSFQCHRKDMKLHQEKKCISRTINCSSICQLPVPVTKKKSHCCARELKKYVDKLLQEREELNTKLEKSQEEIRRLECDLKNLREENRGRISVSPSITSSSDSISLENEDYNDVWEATNRTFGSMLSALGFPFLGNNESADDALTPTTRNAPLVSTPVDDIEMNSSHGNSHESESSSDSSSDNEDNSGRTRGSESLQNSIRFPRRVEPTMNLDSNTELADETNQNDEEEGNIRALTSSDNITRHRLRLRNRARYRRSLLPEVDTPASHPDYTNNSECFDEAHVGETISVTTFGLLSGTRTEEMLNEGSSDSDIEWEPHSDDIDWSADDEVNDSDEINDSENDDPSEEESGSSSSAAPAENTCESDSSYEPEVPERTMDLMLRYCDESSDDDEEWHPWLS